MSCYIKVYACTDNTSEIYQKHLNAVKFCVENNLSLPSETSNFFKGKIGDGDLEDYEKEYWYDYVKSGFSTYLDSDDSYIEIDMKDIPVNTKKLIITLE